MFGWTADEHASFAVLDAFVDGGDNLMKDTLGALDALVPAGNVLGCLPYFALARG